MPDMDSYTDKADPNDRLLAREIADGIADVSPPALLSPHELLYTTAGMAAAVAPAAHIRQILRFEVALAHAEAQAGLIPQEAAGAIAEGCTAAQIDVAELYRQAALAGTVVIPLVKMLAEYVPTIGRAYIHWGATSQDAIDTALMLQMRIGLGLLEADLLRICSACARLAEQHRRTLMVGRTLLQHALPITFGLKAARWLALATRQVTAIRSLRAQLTLQFGGAAGTLAALGQHGIQVATLLAESLGLVLADLPWHAERDRIGTIAGSLGVTVGAAATIAQDLLLLSQTEVGEVSEIQLPGKGGSSALPHKHNPVDATMALACARLALSQVPSVLGVFAHEHERSAGAWQAEWAAIPDLLRYTSGAISRVAQALEGLQIDAARMQTNLEMGNGLVMAESLTLALAPQLGRQEAQQLVQELVQETQRRSATLHTVAQEDTHVQMFLSPTAIALALDPAHYLGSTNALIDRALAAYQAIRS